MDIHTATSLLTNTENIKYFKEQLRHFQREQTSSLKDYLDLISEDVVKWLSSLPKGVKSKSTFHKYKSPLYFLLEHKDTINVYGETYCVGVLRSMKQAFKDSIDKIISERKQSNCASVDDNVTENASECQSDDESVIDINTLEVVEDVVAIDTNDYKKEYELMKNKYDRLLFEHNLVKTMLESQLSIAWRLVDKMVK
jgi:ribosomal silencing factor RsfS